MLPGADGTAGTFDEGGYTLVGVFPHGDTLWLAYRQ